MDISRYCLPVGIFTWLLKYFPKNRAILVQKLGEEKKWSKSVSGYLKTKKNFLWPLSPRGGGSKALMARPLREELFFAASLIYDVKFWNVTHF